MIRPTAARRRQLKEAHSLGPLSILDREIDDWSRRQRLRGPMPSLGAALTAAGACATIAKYRRRLDDRAWKERVWRWAIDGAPTAMLRSVGSYLDNYLR